MRIRRTEKYKTKAYLVRGKERYAFWCDVKQNKQFDPMTGAVTMVNNFTCETESQLTFELRDKVEFNYAIRNGKYELRVGEPFFEEPIEGYNNGLRGKAVTKKTFKLE